MISVAGQHIFNGCFPAVRDSIVPEMPYTCRPMYRMNTSHDLLLRSARSDGMFFPQLNLRHFESS